MRHCRNVRKEYVFRNGILAASALLSGHSGLAADTPQSLMAKIFLQTLGFRLKN